jgi:hypothetical protein
MSRTPQAMFKHKWRGLEQIGILLNDRPSLSLRSSVDPSFGEDLQELVSIIELVLWYPNIISDAVNDKKLTKDNLCEEMKNLKYRIKEATERLQLGKLEIENLINDILNS